MTYLQFRAAIRQDSALNQRAEDFLDRIGREKAPAFWDAVQRMHIDELDEFRNLMALADNEIMAYLKVDQKSVADAVVDALKSRIDEVNKYLGGTLGPKTEKWADELEKKAEALKKRWL